MELPKIAPREECPAARLQLLAKEKELSRAHAALAAERQALPMVEISKDYTFTGPNGQVRLAGLFEGRGQFVRDGDRVFHTYPTYGVGADVMLSTYRFLDLTPSGRQRYINEWPWHDAYGHPVGDAHRHG